MTPSPNQWDSELREFEDKYCEATHDHGDCEFIAELRSALNRAYEKGELQGRLTAFEILHGHFMNSRNVAVLDAIEAAQRAILIPPTPQKERGRM